MELSRATQVLAAYSGDRFLGVLLAKYKDEPRAYHSFIADVYVGMVGLIQRIFASGADSYDAANRRMLDEFEQGADPAGEICFLAADPHSGVKGVGTALLSELVQRERGRLTYLYTDSNCTYQFYERRGFEIVGQEQIRMDLGKKSVPLTCYLFAKVL